MGSPRVSGQPVTNEARENEFGEIEFGDLDFVGILNFGDSDYLGVWIWGFWSGKSEAGEMEAEDSDCVPILGGIFNTLPTNL